MSVIKLITASSCEAINMFNPNSHGGFFVSRLTAVGHMRHPFKADLGEK
jgi:hypothetical protein